MKIRYALRFSPLDEMMSQTSSRRRKTAGIGGSASAGPISEVVDLIRFKTRTLTAIGEQRSSVWGDESVSQKLEHLALMFGALSAAPDGAVAGLGVSVEKLSMAMLVLPSACD